MMTKLFLDRGFNFGAGPAMLPQEILQEAQMELLNWQNSGMSILEINHRSEAYLALMHELEQDLRALLMIPEDYTVLFLNGSARTHFALIPLHFIRSSQQAGFIISGLWSQLAFAEASRCKDAYCVASSFNSEICSSITTPLYGKEDIKDNTAYLYYTSNETVNGVRFKDTPKTYSLPLIADMTSSLLSEPINVKNYALIFAGAQKNIANAGLTLIIIQNDFLEKSLAASLPISFSYLNHAQYHSLYTTPATFNCYIAHKMFKWIKNQGGVRSLYQKNLAKSQKLYHYIDHSLLYECPVVKEARSHVNVCFHLRNRSLEKQFLTAANERGLFALQGHRTTGGMRASLYNAMPMEGIEALIEFMQDFAQQGLL